MSQKAALIFIAGKIRAGQFPKLPGFSYNEEHQKYLYSGAPVPLDEFNAAAEVALDPTDRRFSISVRIVDVPSPEEVAAKAKAAAEAAKAEADRLAAIAEEEAAKAEADRAAIIAEKKAAARAKAESNKTSP